MSVEQPPRRELTISEVVEQPMDESIEVAVDTSELRTERRQLFAALDLIFPKDKGTQAEGRELLMDTIITIKERRLRMMDFIGRGDWGYVITVEDISRPGEVMALKLSAPFDRTAKDNMLPLPPEDADEDAIKAYEDSLLTADAVRGIFREVEATKKLSAHPDSPYPHYYDAQLIPNPDHPEQRTMALLMEKLEGENLEALITEGLNESPEVLLNIARQFARAVEYTHRAGFVHRDIKPGNALIDEHDRVRMIDLGFAVRQDHATNSATYRQPVEGTMNGSHFYMHEDEPDRLSPAHDVYTLGRTFQHLLVGKEFRLAMNLRISVSRITDPIVKKFADLSYRMIRTEPSERPTMPQVLAELDRLESQLQQDEVRKQISA